MNFDFKEACFINPGIEIGIKSYIKSKYNEVYKKKYLFEIYVIKALILIYGEKSVLLPYQIDNETAFKCNLLIYDLKESTMEYFLDLMNSYYEFVNNIDLASKSSGLIYEIEKILIEMIKLRNKVKPFTTEELNKFDIIFNPTNGDFKEIISLLSKDNGLIKKEWDNDKLVITETQYNMMKVNTNLLNPNIYEKFGLDFKIVSSLGNEEILAINEKILKEENSVTNINNKIIKPKMLLTCGNGFVDKLFLMSIVTTEILVGLVIFSCFGG